MNDTKPRYRISRYAGILAAALGVIVVAYLFICWGTQTTILLVRHADRQGTADALSPAGTARAQDLARVVAESGISAIYTSEAVRTQQTAAPAASLLGITPVVVPAADVAGLVSSIRGNYAGQAVLVVGHSNTVPQIIAELGGPAVTLGETEFDNFYVLTLCCYRWQTVKLTNLQYGAASP
jgi:broad specificity phosphatase PhoE